LEDVPVFYKLLFYFPNSRDIFNDESKGYTLLFVFPKRKESFVSSSGLPARPSVCRPPEVLSNTTATQTERKVCKFEWTITKWKQDDKDIEHIVMIKCD
jgi:hypothetical protein